MPAVIDQLTMELMPLENHAGPPAARSVYFDTQIFDVIGKTISIDDWQRVLGSARAGHFDYCVSLNTVYELIQPLAAGSARHLIFNKQRLLKLLIAPRTTILPFTGEFLRYTLGLATRPDLAHYSLHLLTPVLDNAGKSEELVSASQNIQDQIEYGKAIWVKALNELANGQGQIPGPDAYARFIALENGIPATPFILEEIAQRLDAAYCHIVNIAKDVLNPGSRYKYEANTPDWLDNQQLFYLSDPSFTFVTLDPQTHKEDCPKRSGEPGITFS